MCGQRSLMRMRSRMSSKSHGVECWLPWLNVGHGGGRGLTGVFRRCSMESLGRHCAQCGSAVGSDVSRCDVCGMALAGGDPEGVGGLPASVPTRDMYGME